MPPVDRLHRELHAKGLEVLLVNFRENPAHVRQVVKERGYVARVLLDQSGEVTGRQYGVWSPPTVYLIDREGRLVGRGVGPLPWDGVLARDFLLALLAERPKP